jgi:hypothetical protein
MGGVTALPRLSRRRIPLAIAWVIIMGAGLASRSIPALVPRSFRQIPGRRAVGVDGRPNGARTSRSWLSFETTLRPDLSRLVRALHHNPAQSGNTFRRKIVADADTRNLNRNSF